MTMPAPPAPTPDAGPTPPAPAPAAQPPAPAPQPVPQTQPPVPQPPTWTPPPPPQPSDDMDGLDKLPQKWQKHIKDKNDEAAKYRVRARSETVLRHAYTTAAAHGVNPDALLGSVAFAENSKNLDPNATDFPAKLAEAIQTALKANPWMAAQQAAAAPPPADPTPAPPPGPSGGDFTGTGGQPGTPNIDQQIAEAEKAGDHALAIRLKRLRAAPPTQ